MTEDYSTKVSVKVSVLTNKDGEKINMVWSRILVSAFSLSLLFLSACSMPNSEGHTPEHHEESKIVATCPKVMDMQISQSFVCQIHSQRNSEMRPNAEGFLEQIRIKEGQAVKSGDVLFSIIPILYKAKLDAEAAEVKLADLELKYTLRLFEDKNQVVSKNEVALFEAKLAKAQAKYDQAKAELNFTEIRAPYDGIIDSLRIQQGSLVKKEDLLTTIFDNSVMWVDFFVPEVKHYQFQATPVQEREKWLIELLLVNGKKFTQTGKIMAIGGKFNSETGNIRYRADFPNPDRLLRHGQSGNIQITRSLTNSIVIPQRATFEVLDKRYVFVIDEHHKVHQQEIVVAYEMDDIFILKSGLKADEKIVLEGVRQVRDSETVEAEFRHIDEVLAHLKNRAE